MANFYTNTAKYYRLAIKEFLPLLETLKQKNQNKEDILRELNDLIEIYQDVAKKIDFYNLDLTDPNRFYKKEPDEINNIDLNDKMIEHFSRLSLRLLNTWQNRKKEIENKEYLTEKNKEDYFILEELIWPLKAQFNNQSMLFFKYKDKGPIKFPGEEITQEKAKNINEHINGLFPIELIEKLPKDLQILCSEFNFNYKNRKPWSCILLLRRILPLSIIRKFQKLDEEAAIIENGEYLNVKELVGKAEKILKTKRLYQEIINYKPLLDSAQHSYTLSITIIDVEGAGIKVRLFLEDLFGSN